MKKSILILFALIVGGLSLSSFRFQNEAKAIAIVNKADWCSICKAYASRTVSTFAENNVDNYFTLIVNDMTDETSKNASKEAIAKVGLLKSTEASIAAGVISFYDLKSKALLAQVTVANSADEIVAIMKMVREKASR